MGRLLDWTLISQKELCHGKDLINLGQRGTLVQNERDRGERQRDRGEGQREGDKRGRKREQEGEERQWRERGLMVERELEVGGSDY